MSQRFHSLRVRLLLPLLAVSILAAFAVAFASYWLGDRWAKQQISERYEGISDTLSGAPFPLKQHIIDSLAELANTELMTLRSDGSVIASSVPLPSDFVAGDVDREADPLDNSMRIADRRFLYGVFPRTGPGSSDDGVDRVAVLFDESELQAARLRAAGLPLATGLSTVFLLTSVTLLMAGRLIGRLSRLGQKVDQIAEGDFDADVPIGVHDEIGLLGTAVGRMSGQLRQMWQQLSRSQGEKLLHQIAGGLAHQLRNSLTGARMAIELHRRSCSQDDETIRVALAQLEQTEDHVRRLLLVAAGKQDKDHPANVAQCLNDIRSSLTTTAQHLHVELHWNVAAELENESVCDGPSLSAAVSNLVLNAMQAGQSVTVNVSRFDDQMMRILVADDGAGPPIELASELFDPFVTSKPEGLGLGLPLVARAAERLGGRVEWGREADQTHFVLTARLIEPSSTQEHS